MDSAGTVKKERSSGQYCSNGLKSVEEMVTGS
jgi:hypothetical protein